MGHGRCRHLLVDRIDVRQFRPDTAVPDLRRDVAHRAFRDERRVRRLSDRIGRQRTMLVAVGIVITALVVTSLADPLATLTLG